MTDPIGRPWMCPRCYHVNGADMGACAFCRRERVTRAAAFVVAMMMVIGGSVIRERIHEIITAAHAG